MDGLILAARILFVVFFLNGGIGHFMKRPMMAGYLKSTGAPFAEFLVPASGLQLVAGSIMVAAGIYGDLGALLIAAFLVPTSLIVHPFWKDTDPQQKMQNQMAFTRNVSFLGAALLVFALYAHFGDGFGLTVTDPLWTIR